MNVQMFTPAQDIDTNFSVCGSFWLNCNCEFLISDEGDGDSKNLDILTTCCELLVLPG